MMIFFWKKRLFGQAVLFLWFAVFFPAVATGPEQWMRATSQTVLKKQIKKEEMEEKLKVLCFLQLKKKQVPYSCYEWRKSVSSQGEAGNTSTGEITGLFGDGVPTTVRSAGAFLAYLNEKCQSSAPHLKNLKKISSLLQIQALSPFCRKQIEKQKRIREYQLRDETPENLMKWHYPFIIERAE